MSDCDGGGEPARLDAESIAGADVTLARGPLWAQMFASVTRYADGASDARRHAGELALRMTTTF